MTTKNINKNMKIRVLTWNINAIQNIHFYLQEILEPEYDSEILIISLQETNNNTILNLLKFVEGTNFEFCYYNNSTNKATLICSRVKLEVKENCFVFGKYFFNKGAIVSTITIGDNKTFYFVNLHLEAKDGQQERRKNQLMYVLGSIKKNKYPIVIAGDFNFRMKGFDDEGLDILKDVHNLKEPFRLNKYSYKYIKGTDELDSARISSYTDRIFYTGDIQTTEYKTVEYYKSDHLPVIADMEIKSFENKEPVVIGKKYLKLKESAEVFVNRVSIFTALVVGSLFFYFSKSRIFE